MKFGVVNKSTLLNRFVFHTLQCNITHLAVITRTTNIRLGILKGWRENWKRAQFYFFHLPSLPQLLYPLNTFTFPLPISSPFPLFPKQPKDHTSNYPHRVGRCGEISERSGWWVVFAGGIEEEFKNWRKKCWPPFSTIRIIFKCWKTFGEVG